MEFHSVSNFTFGFGGRGCKEKGGPEIPEWVVQKTRGPMMTVWETEADMVRTQEKRWGSADRKREWASLAEHGFVQYFPLSQLSQQPCTILAGCRSGALEEAGEG